MGKAHINLPPKIEKFINKEIETHGGSKNELIIKALAHFKKCRRTLRYKGFMRRQMSEDFTCCECNRPRTRGETAMYNHETGEAMCLRCAINKEMVSRDRVDLYVRKLRLEQDIKAFKKELAMLANYYQDLTVDVDDAKQLEDEKKLIKKMFDVSQQNLELIKTSRDDEERKIHEDLNRLYLEATQIIRELEFRREQIRRKREQVKKKAKKWQSKKAKKRVEA